MDGADAFAVSSSNAWWSSLVRGYFSSATLFLLLNVVIGTIALTSRSHRGRHQHRDDDHQQQKQQYQQHASPPPTPLERTSSVMERLRSLGLYRFRSGDFPPEYNHHLSAATGGTTSDARSAQQADHHQYTRSRSEQAPRPPPVRKNNNKEEEVSVRAAKKSTPEAKKLEHAPARAQARRAPRAPAPTAARALVLRGEVDAAAVSVDARADDFINRFRQQLQLQRLNSLLNYSEMLNRGT